MLTVFTSPKPFRGRIDTIQRNALSSWMHLGSDVEVLVIGDEEGAREAALAAGARHLPQVERNALGTPLSSSIFSLAAREARHSTLCYVNADIILLSEFLTAIRRVTERFERFLIVGQRWDLEVNEGLEFDGDWEAELRARVRRAGRLHPPAGSDYFVFPRGLFTEMPRFALGRAGWDNWMIYAGRARRIPVVDVTSEVTVIHQNHDYGHLPGGQPHYRLPESQDNVALAGGREVIFGLCDTDWRLEATGLRRRRRREVGLVRWLETSWTLRVGPGRKARVVRLLLHPADMLSYFIKRLRGKVPRGDDLALSRSQERPNGHGPERSA